VTTRLFPVLWARAALVVRQPLACPDAKALRRTRAGRAAPRRESQPPFAGPSGQPPPGTRYSVEVSYARPGGSAPAGAAGTPPDPSAPSEPPATLPAQNNPGKKKGIPEGKRICRVREKDKIRRVIQGGERYAKFISSRGMLP
jgi:hypothetical protein